MQMLVPTSTGERVIHTDEIDWIAARDYYAQLYVGGRRYLLRESLASLVVRLEGCALLRVHRSAVVNMRRVRELRFLPHRASLLLEDGTAIAVSRRRRDLVRAAFRSVHQQAG